MKYKMIAYDMDGTLLNSQKQISDNTISAIKDAMNKGVHIIFNTGRCPSELAEYFDVLDIEYLNCISGALVYDRKNGKAISSLSLEHNDVLRLLEIAKEEDVMVQILNKDSIIEKDKFLNIEKYHMGVYREMYDRVAIKLDDIYEEYKRNPFSVEKLNIYHTSEEARERTRQRIEEANIDIVLANAESTSLEVSPKGVSKALGLMKLCEHLNITLEDVIVVGDADNDIEALKVAGLSVAMGNAKQHIKDMCDVIVSDNDHDGCVDVIEKYL